MLQVTFRNLLPSEVLVREANDAYLALRACANPRSRRLRCHVTISAESATDERTDWVFVQLELIWDRGRPVRVLAEGADARHVVRSGMAALSRATVRVPGQWPSAPCAAARLLSRQSPAQSGAWRMQKCDADPHGQAEI